MKPLVLIALLLMGCGSSELPMQKSVDREGVLEDKWLEASDYQILNCQSGYEECIEKAEHICKNDGYKGMTLSQWSSEKVKLHFTCFTWEIK